MLQGLTGWHALVVLAVILLVFGATRLPALARSVGQSVSILKREVADPADASPGDRARDDRTAAERVPADRVDEPSAPSTARP